MSIAVCKDTRDLLEKTHQKVSNASLLYEKYILPRNFGGRNSPEAKVVKEEAFRKLIQTQPELNFQQRSKHVASILQRDPQNHFTEILGKLESRLAINLGDGLIENAGISLDRNFGYPYIPASAVKGCCHHAAYWLGQEKILDPLLVRVLFGYSNSDNEQAKGCVNFLPATPIEVARITLDILTPHRIDEHGNEVDPVPNKYPVVEAGVTFSFPYWLNATFRRNSTFTPEQVHEAMSTIMNRAFDEGIGAKTAAGMGWFSRNTDQEELDRKTREAADARRAEEEAQKQKELNDKLKAEKDRATKKAEAEENERRRIENEKQKQINEKKLQDKIANASPEDRLRLELSQLSKSAFSKEIRMIKTKDPREQKIILEVLDDKKNPKRLIKDAKLKEADIEKIRKEIQNL